MTTYTIAYGHDLLLACVPDGVNLQAALAREAKQAAVDPADFGEVTTIAGLHLTDQPLDGDEVVHRGHSTGWLSDEAGRTYDYAVRRGPGPAEQSAAT